MGLPFADPTSTGQWAQDLLYDLGAPETQFNIGYLEAWQQHESPSGYGYNPLGEETTANKSKNANSAGVQAYTSWQEGLDTTVSNLESLPQDSAIVADLRQGNAGYAALAGAQSQGGWRTGAESMIAAPGVSDQFTYGGSYGEQQGAKGIATSSRGVTGDIWHTITDPFGTGKQIGSDINNAIGPGAIAKKLSSSVFGPVTGWIEEGAADVTFIGFGLLLVVVGLIVTFKGSSGGDTVIETTKDAAGDAVA